MRKLKLKGLIRLSKKFFDSLFSAFPSIQSYFFKKSSEKYVTSYVDNIYLGAGKCSPKLGGNRKFIMERKLSALNSH